MAAKTIAALNDIGADILASKVGANGVITVQIGDSTNEEVRCDGAEWWQHVGFASLPSNATKEGASAQAIAIEQSDFDVVVASRDTRNASRASALGPGETLLYASGPEGSGSPQVYLKSRQGGQSVTLSVGTNVVVVKDDGTVELGGPTRDAVAMATPLETMLTALRTFSTAAKASVTDPVLSAAALALETSLLAVTGISSTTVRASV